VTDSESTPASGTTFDVDADCHARETFTYETGKYVRLWLRRIDDDNYGADIRAQDGKIKLYEGDDGVDTHLESTGTVLSDGVAYQLDVVLEGTSVKIYLDNVLQIDQTLQYQLTTAAGRVTHDLASNDIELSTHPYPSLGIATDRVIAPQDEGTSVHTSDCVVCLRNVLLPTVGNSKYKLRKQDADNYVMAWWDLNGTLRIYEVIGGVLNSRASTATAVSDNDDLAFILDGTSAEIFVNGTSQVSGTLTTILTGTDGEWIQSGSGGETIDSVELFPRDVSALLPSELV
jgi:hypothetical protein